MTAASWLPLKLVCLALAICSPTLADTILDWNRTATDVLVADVISQHPGMASRTMAMTNIAMYDAFQLTSPGAVPYYDYTGAITSPVGVASREAAASQAAFTVLSQNYPDQIPELNAKLATSLATIPDGAAKTEGISLGTQIGSSIVNRRANDGYDSNVQFVPTGEIGHWEPDPINPGQEAWGPVWGEVRPFSIRAGSQFPVVPMPALDSAEYAAAFNEVKDLGAKISSTRTADQTEAGIFWAYDRIGLGTPMRMFNRVLQNVAEQEQNTPEQNAELFARATVALVDAGIAAWNAKFEHDFWRPISAIRRADDDGNVLTDADPNWEPLGSPNVGGNDFTPPFPTYVSGHATFGGALFTTLTQFYGTDDIGLTLTSEELAGVERVFSSFSEAMVENGRSRVYLGVHFSFDDFVAQDLGIDVANHIFSRPFVAYVPEPSGFIALATILLAFAARQNPRKSRVSKNDG